MDWDITYYLYSELELEFFSRVKFSNDCWLWQGAKNSNGYGILSWHSKPIKAHRWSYEYFKDPYKFRQNMRIKCTRGDLAPEVNAYGDISMCFYMPPIGNIRKDNIKDIWYGEEMKKIRERINHCDLDCDLAVNCFYKIENITDYIE